MSVNIVDVQFLDRQKEALRELQIDSPVQQVLYGGAAGGGKTKLGCIWQIQRRLKYAGTRSLIGRSKLDTLKKTTLKTFFETAKELNLVNGHHYTFNAQSNIISFYNGSEIILKDLFAYPSDENFDVLGGLELTDYFCDEVSEITEKAINIVHSRCRYKLNEYNLIPKGLLTCNPSKNWIYNEFYLKAQNKELPAHRAFIQALPKDNVHLPESYIQSLTLLPEYDRKRLLEGSWEYDDDSDRLFTTENLIRCFRNELLEGTKYITADIARFGKDRTVICVWNGMTITDIIEMRRSSLDEVVAEIRKQTKIHNIVLQNVLADEDGLGSGVVDFLKCRGYHNGGKPRNALYKNIKAECYYKLAEYIEENKLTILNNTFKEQIIKELETIKRHKADVEGKLQITPKEQIKNLTGASPDMADAIMMRMYFELNKSYNQYVIA